MTDKYLIRSDEIAAMAGTAKTHFLNPLGKRINKSLGDAAGLTGIGFHLIEVQPGDETTEHHVHYFEDECVFVLSGTATATIGEEDFPIGAGDFIGYRKGGAAHSIKNTGTELLRCIVAGQRLPHEVCDYPRLGKRLFSSPGMRWNLIALEDIEEIGGNAGKK